MANRIIVGLLVSTMVQAGPMKNEEVGESREARWGKHGNYKDGEWEKKYESPKYSVERVEDSYEKRVYPASTWACTNMTVDTAEDPLAGLEDWDFKEIMQSKRYKTKVPSSLMFYPLFRYISGNNEGEVKIEMTRGVTTSHSVLKRDRVWGDLEMQQMCFYLEGKFQPDGSEPVPAPTDPAVYILSKPVLAVFVMQFPGWAFTSAVWQANRDILEEELSTRESFNSTLYYTAMKSHPWVPENQRINEIGFPEAESDQ